MADDTGGTPPEAGAGEGDERRSQGSRAGVEEVRRVFGRSERVHPGNVTTLEGASGRAIALSQALVPLGDVESVLRNRYLVKGWLDRGAVSVVFGESNVGKTFLALDLALHVAAGAPWHGHKVAADDGAEGNLVVYVAGEGGHGIRNRIEAFRSKRPGVMDRAQELDAFRLLPMPLDLYAPSDAAAISHVLRNMSAKAGLIVVDTLSRAMGEGDENTARDMGMFIRNVDRLREETGAHVMVIHHSGKDATKGARGSSVLRGAVDTELELRRDGVVVMAEVKKQRDMPCEGVFAYTLHSVLLGSDEDGDDVTSAVVEPAEPVKRRPQVTGQAKIALQAFGDALGEFGEVIKSDRFPRNRQVVSVERWREFCQRHSLTSSDNPNTERSSFSKSKDTLLRKGILKELDGYVWRCGDEE